MTDTIKTYNDVQNAIEMLKNTGCLTVNEEEIKLLKCFRILNATNRFRALSRVEGMVEGQMFVENTQKETA